MTTNSVAVDVLWIAGISLGIICALIGVIYWASQRRDDKQDERMESSEDALRNHIREDIGAHERIRALEVRVEAHDREIGGLRDRWHDLRTEVAQTLAGWYTNIVDYIDNRKPK